MKTNIKPSRYCAYLLRCWQEAESSATDDVSASLPWRFAVEEVFGERRRHGFESLEAALDFVQAEVSHAQQPDQEKEVRLSKT